MLKFIKDKKLLVRRVFLITIDMISIIAASGLALLVRFNMEFHMIELRFLDHLWGYLWINLLTTLILFYIFRLYHSLWIFAGINELENIISACVLSAIIQAIGMNLTGYTMPRTFYFSYPFFLITFVSATRFAYRALRQALYRSQSRNTGVNVMVIGAGEAANMIIKEIISSRYLHKTVKCVIDDSPDKIGSYIHGIKVVGNRYTIIANAKRYKIHEINIAMPSVSKKRIREIISICKETGCRLKILPGLYQFMTGEASVSQLRDVEVEDLLVRDPIEVDLDSIMGYVKNKTILVTGGGGSIGSELCRQIASHEPKHLIILDIYENGVYDVQQELIHQYPNLKLTVLIASVRNTNRINKIFEVYRPEIVYHAAAHKHVPLMEDSPNEAIKNNVFGTLKTVRAADRYGTERFVLISTDKAVNPTNIMGASKRICEMIIQTYNKMSETEFVAVRFGNVMSSNGSVIPLFKKQIAAGGPVTVTDPEVIRYFMTIQEAVALVLQAGAYARGGEIFVLDMGEPVKIIDLARHLISLSGFIPDEEIKIQIIGLRPGEKLFEELLMKEEGMQETENKLIHIGHPIDIDETVFLKQLEKLEQMSREEPDDIRRMVKEIVPTYEYEQNDRT